MPGGVLTNPPKMCKDICMAEQQTKITISTDDLLSVPQAAKRLGVHFATVYRWIDKGRIHPIRIGGQVFVTVDEIRALNEKTAKPSGKQGAEYETGARSSVG